MEDKSRVAITGADRAFLKLGLVAIILAMTVTGAYATVVVALDRHPSAP